MYSLKPTPTEVSLRLAKRHRMLRRQLRLSQEELADRSGVSLGSLKRFERTGKISLASLLRLMHLLGRLDEIDALLRPVENMEEVQKLFTE